MLQVFPKSASSDPRFLGPRLAAKAIAADPSTFLAFANSFCPNEDNVKFPTGHVVTFKNANFRRDTFIAQQIGFGVGIYKISRSIRSFVTDESARRIREAVNAKIADEGPTVHDDDSDASASKRWAQRLSYAPELGAGGRVGLYFHMTKDPTHNYVVVFAGAPRAAYNDFEAHLEALEQRNSLHGVSVGGLSGISGSMSGLATLASPGAATPSTPTGAEPLFAFGDPLRRHLSTGSIVVTASASNAGTSGTQFQDVLPEFEVLQRLARENRRALAKAFMEAIGESVTQDTSLVESHEVIWNTLSVELGQVFCYYSDVCHGQSHVEYGDPFAPITVSHRDNVLVADPESAFGGVPCVRRFDSSQRRTDVTPELLTRHVTLDGYAVTEPASLYATWSDVSTLASGLAESLRMRDLLTLTPQFVRHSRRAYDDTVSVGTRSVDTLDYFFAVPERDELMRPSHSVNKKAERGGVPASTSAQTASAGLKAASVSTVNTSSANAYASADSRSTSSTLAQVQTRGAQSP